MNQPLLYTIPMACESLAISRSQLYKLINTGNLRTVSIGRSRRIVVESLSMYIERLVSDGKTCDI